MIRLRAIRAQLTLWYVGLLAVILCLFGKLLYANVAASIASDVDNVLTSQADGVTEALFAFWGGEWEAVRHGKRTDLAAPPMAHALDAGLLPDLMSRWAQQTSYLESPRPIRLMDLEGRVLEVSRSFAQPALPLTADTLTAARQGRTVYETFRLPDHRVRLMTRPVIEDNRTLYLVQVAANLHQADVSLERLRRWLLWLIPLTLVVTSSVGAFLAATALRPVGRMIKQARAISAAKLDARIEVPRTGDELERLATTFNDMLTRLERAFRQLRQFSAAASHELRTPLTIMKGELEVALRKPRGPDEYQRVLRTHLEALDEMTQIVEELLILARSDLGEGAVAWRPVELGSLAQQVRESLRRLADPKGITVEIPPHEPVWVRGEQRLLERLIMNLLDNAIRHTPIQGRVRVHLQPEGTLARLVVNDTGPGIPADILPRVFDQFFSYRAAGRDDRPSGFGLGLCRWIAEVHQGSMTAHSAPGEGATLTVSLPLATPPS